MTPLGPSGSREQRRGGKSLWQEDQQGFLVAQMVTRVSFHQEGAQCMGGTTESCPLQAPNRRVGIICGALPGARETTWE